LGGSFLLILASVGCGVVGQLSLKAGMGRVGELDSGSVAQPLALVLRVLAQPMVLAGLACYVLGVLSRVSLSLAYPSLAIGYVLTALLAWLVLGEQVPPARWIGIATICLGVFLLSRS
jgi:multidrug transporter EmrE-like cation transporter